MTTPPGADAAPRDARDENRCALCGWPLAVNAKDGCVRGNCGYRPEPPLTPDHYYDIDRASREYGIDFAKGLPRNAPRAPDPRPAPDVSDDDESPPPMNADELRLYRLCLSLGMERPGDVHDEEDGVTVADMLDVVEEWISAKRKEDPRPAAGGVERWKEYSRVAEDRDEWRHRAERAEDERDAARKLAKLAACWCAGDIIELNWNEQACTEQAILLPVRRVVDRLKEAEARVAELTGMTVADVERAADAILAIVPEGYGMYRDEAVRYARAAIAALTNARPPDQRRESARGEAVLSMILPCPRCRELHVDAPEPEKGWTNPPHKSHLCHYCGLVWRPADVPTNGVASIATIGKDDNWKPGEKRPERQGGGE